MLKRLGGIIGCKYKTSSWHPNGFSDGSNIDAVCVDTFWEQISHFLMVGRGTVRVCFSVTKTLSDDSDWTDEGFHYHRRAAGNVGECYCICRAFWEDQNSSLSVEQTMYCIQYGAAAVMDED